MEATPAFDALGCALPALVVVAALVAAGGGVGPSERSGCWDAPSYVFVSKELALT